MTARRRVLALLGLLVLLVALGRAAFGPDVFTEDGLIAYVENAGPWALVFYALMVCLGLLIQIPGLVLAGAGLVLFGPRLGPAVVLVAGIVGVTVSFVVVRAAKGRGRLGLRPPRPLSRALDRLETHPISTIVALRLFAFLSPPLNFALAMTRVRLRDYVVGSALGIAPSVAVLAIMSTCLGWL